MKKFILIAVAAFTFAACNNDVADENEVVDPTESTSTSENAAYTPLDGDVRYENNRLMEWREGNWIETDNEVRMDNGTVINPNGEVRREDEVFELHEGEMMNRAGEVRDKTGAVVRNAWNETKEGVREAGDALKKAGKEVEQETDQIGNDGNH